jgi:tetratricopeptide (TPR) repeat protein
VRRYSHSSPAGVWRKGRALLLRTILVGLFGLLAAATVVRTAAVAELAERQPATASSFWPSHPEVLRSVAMGQVGEAAGQGREPSQQTLALLQQLAKAEPLAPEPLLIQAAIAQRSGGYRRAERLLVQARDRDPRSAAARFLLADLYLRTGRVLPGLAEMSVLARLIPGSMEQVAPALSAYASSAGAVPHLKRILLVYPELELSLLSRLADDPDNAELILAIARPQESDEPPRWQTKLLGKLVAARDYARAQAIWARLSGMSARESRGLYNPGFDRSSAPPPFNWTLASGADGVAEPNDGGLRVLYFGRDDVVLARQLMLLPAGRYQLQMTLAGDAGGGAEIGWTVTCLPGRRILFELPLGGGKPPGGQFEVPAAGCSAQQLELKAEAGELPQEADFRISGLKLTRVG